MRGTLLALMLVCGSAHAEGIVFNTSGDGDDTSLAAAYEIGVAAQEDRAVYVPADDRVLVVSFHTAAPPAYRIGASPQDERWVFALICFGSALAGMLVGHLVGGLLRVRALSRYEAAQAERMNRGTGPFRDADGGGRVELGTRTAADPAARITVVDHPERPRSH